MVYKFRSSGRISGIGWRQKQKVLNSGKLKAELCSLLSKGKTWSTSSLNLPYLHTNRKGKSVRQLTENKKAPFNSQEDLEQRSRIRSHQHNLWQLKLTSELLLRNLTDQYAHLRGLVALGLFLYELSFGVNSKDSAEWYSNLLIGKDVLK